MAKKYDPLNKWLTDKAEAGEVVVHATFAEIEEIIGAPLPKSARQQTDWWMHRHGEDWWANDETHPQAQSWLNARWKVQEPNRNNKTLLFIKFPKAVFISEAIKQLETKSMIICPDTCVLLNIVRRSKENEVPIFDDLELWSKQLDRCEDLLSSDAVGWVMPEQIEREFKDNRKNQFQAFRSIDQAFRSIERKLISNKELEVSSVSDLKVSLESALTALEVRAKACLGNILQKAILLKEKEQIPFIKEAWALVHGNRFPNKKGNQQMKDSVILSHLYALCRFGGSQNFGQKPAIIANVYFWTFDNFDKQIEDKIGLFPHGEAKEHIEITHDIIYIADQFAVPSTSGFQP